MFTISFSYRDQPYHFRKIPGVIQIEICDEPASVSIFAESKEAAQKARQVSCGCLYQEYQIYSSDT